MNGVAIRHWLYHPRVYPFAVLAVLLVVLAAFNVIGFGGNLRWIKAAIGLGVVASLLVTPLSVGLGVFLLATIFPANIVLGPTNFVLATLTFVAWMMRAALGTAPGIRRTPCDLPLAILTLGYLLSWMNVNTGDAYSLRQAWFYTQNHLGSLMVFYMAYVAVEAPRDARNFVRWLTVMAFMIYGFAVLEVLTGTSITGLGRMGGAQYRLGGGVLRAGGLLGSHDMLADFCSINIPLHLFLLYRATRPVERLTYALLLVLCLVALFMTSNRGGMVGFAAGMIYLALLLRKSLGAPVLVGLVGLGTFLLGVVDQLLSRSGRTLSVFYRFAHTRFYGVLPETRVGVFRHLKLRIAEHPILGEGPFYRLRHEDPSVIVFWPHNAFAYYWATVGLVGLLGFILTMIEVLRKTWQERARGLGEGYLPELMLILHVMMVVFVVTQQRTDFQRGFVFTYYVFFMLGFTLGVWRLTRERRLAREAEESASASA